MSQEQQDSLRCTFEDAEHNHLLDGIRMSTRDKLQLFEDMLDFAWRTGAIKPSKPGEETRKTEVSDSSRL